MPEIDSNKPRPLLTCITVQMAPNGGVIISDTYSAFREPGRIADVLAAFSSITDALTWMSEQPWKGERI